MSEVKKKDLVAPILLASAVDGNGLIHYKYGGGITKREHFAGIAMQGLLVSETVFNDRFELAARSLELADALIAELEKSK